MPETRPTEGLVRFGVFEADLRTRELRKSGMRLKLQDQPFQVLMMLLQRRGQLVTKEEIRQKLWGEDTFVDFEHSIDVCIKKLRDVLSDSPENPRFIETLKKRGYRFIYPVESSSAAPSASRVSAEWTDTAQGTTRPSLGGAVSQTISDFTRPVNARDLARPVSPTVASSLFVLMQIMYLSFYVAALWKFETIQRMFRAELGSAGALASVAIVISAALGIPTRLFLLSAASFRFRGLRQSFRRIFPVLLTLDLLWAFAPFLVLPFGLALAITAALLYAPFGQRTLTYWMEVEAAR
jgi:cholera toxin transcriptional activator